MTGWRALLRVARRDVRRHRGRSLLIVLLVALPVAAMTLALVLGRTAELTPDQRASGYLGQADLLVDSAGVDPGEWQEILPAGSRWVRVGQDFDGIAVVRGDELFRASAFETELGGPLVAGRWQLVEGRAAAGGDELVVSPDVAGDLGVAVGDRLELRRPRRTVTVTGIAIMPTRLGWPFVVVPPGWWSAGGAGSGHDGGQWLVDVGGAEAESVVESLRATFAPVEPVLSEAFRNGGSSRYLSVHTRADLRSEGSPNLAGQVTITYVVGALALAWTGAVAAAAFAVGARRRLREVGLVAAAGGGPRQLRGLLLADGAVLGAWGATAGVGLGLAAAPAMRPHLDRLFDHVIGPLRVPVLAVVGAATVGALAAILAAVAPARGAARVPVLAALAGTRPPRPRTRSWLAVGAVALAVGLGLCWRGGATGSEAAVVGGVLAVVVSAAALSGPLLSLLGRAAARAPLTLRLAARDASRSRSRVAPATVAAMLALAGGIGGVTMLESARADTRQRHVPNLGEDQLYVGLGGTGQGPLLASRPAAASSEELADLVDAVTAAVPGSVAGVVAPASGAVIGDDPRGLAVGDAATLDALGASSALEAFDDGRIVALGRGSTDDGQVVLHRRAGRGPTQVFQGHVDDRGRELPGGTDGPPWAPQELAAVEVDVPVRMAVPGYIVSPAAAEALGVEAVPQGVLLRGPGPVTEEDLRRVELAALDAAPSVPAYVVREDGPCCGDEALVTGVLLGASTLVALLVVGLVIALGREELRPHLATLAAIGAAPRTRRRLGATQAGLVAGLAAALAVPTGLLPAVALLRARPAQPGLGPLTSVGEALTAPVVVPWLLLAGVLLGVTVLGTLAGGVLSFAHRR